jgi:hypothetical protein
LPPRIQEQTQLVVQQREAHLYRTYPTLVLPEHITNLPATRQWIQQNVDSDKVIQLDDDLVFATRRTDDPTKFNPAKPFEVEAMFSTMWDYLNDYAHVGLCPREGANRKKFEVDYNSRMMRVLGYRLDVLRRQEIRHDRMPDVEDFDVNLQLLRLGYKNAVLNEWCHNQGGSNTAGGCSEYRTLDTHRRDVEILQRYHPEFVTVVEKETKTSWGGQKRHDVRIQWKRAFKSAGTIRSLGNDTAQDSY